MAWTIRQGRLLGAFAVAGVAALLACLPLVRIGNLRVLDQAFAWKRAWQPTTSRGVVLVAVDEATEDAFRADPLVLWHRHFAEAFKGLALGGVRGVALDYNLPAQDFDQYAPGSLFELGRGLRQLRGQAPLILGSTVRQDFRGREIAPFLRGILREPGKEEEGLGVVLPPEDPDRVLRRYEDPLDLQGSPVPLLARRLAQRLGLPAGPGYVDFAHGESFTYIPFHRVVAWARSGDEAALRAAFQGQIVFIGSVLPFEDRHRMPLNLAGWETRSHLASGVTLHAQAMRCFLGPGLIRGVPEWLSLIVGMGAALLLWLISGRLLRGAVALLALGAGLFALEFLLLDARWFFPALAPIAGGCAGFLGRQGLESALGLRERWRLRRVFAGYVSPPILEEILSGRLHPGLKGERKAICVLFSDIRNFTALSERLEPEAVIAILNRYFELMAQAIHRRGGTLDKFIGDGIMAFFGAPGALANPCQSAFEAARDMLEALEIFNREWTALGHEPLRIGIGLHFGEASVGHVGSETRNEYTAIGDVVNVASRVEGLTKDSGFPLLLTQAVVDRLAAPEPFQPLGARAIKGHAPMTVFGWPSAPIGENTP